MKSFPITFSYILTWLIAAVWFINGLFCKVLKLTPRHQEIVGQILGEEQAPLLTTLIGIGEIVLAAWIISRIYPRVCASLQIILIMTMNLIERSLASDLLLWGSWNFLFALLFCLFLWWKEFRFDAKLNA